MLPSSLCTPGVRRASAALALAGACVMPGMACAQAQPAINPAEQQAARTHVSRSRQRSAEAAYLLGARELQKSAFPAAERDFAEAVQLNPGKAEYTAALLVAREHLVTNLLQQAALQRPADPGAADTLLDRAREVDRANPRVVQHAAAGTTAINPRRELQAAAAIALRPNATVHSYHERADSRALAARVASDYGLRVAFDPDLPQKTLRLDVDDVAAGEALRIVNLLGNTFAVPLDEHAFLLAANTPENRQRYERMVQETFTLAGYGEDKLKDFVSIAQQLLDIRQLSAAPQGGTLVVRGPAERVAAFERVFQDLVQDPAEVVLELKLYSVDKSHVRNLGVTLPQSLNLFSLASQAQSIVSQNSALISQLIASGTIPANTSTLQLAAYLVFVAGLGNNTLLQNSFLLLGGGLSTAALSAGSIPTLNLALTQSEARSLEDVQLRTSDQQRAMFRSGVRYPIQTSLFSDIASSTASSLAGTTVNGVSLSSLLASYLGTSATGSSAVIPQVQYEDLGLTVSVTPRIQRNSDVALRLEVKLSALAGTALNGIPILDSRQFSSDLTAHDGESILMVSNVNSSESAAVTGLPGLSEIPGFQSTTNRNSSQASGSVVLLITPHIVRHGHTEMAGPRIPLAPRPGDE